MELIVLVGALVALFFMYRQGKLAGVLAQIKAAEAKVAPAAQAVKAAEPGVLASIKSAFSHAEKAATPDLADLLKEVRDLKTAVAQLKAPAGAGPN